MFDTSRIVDAHTHILTPQVWEDYLAAAGFTPAAVMAFTTWTHPTEAPRVSLEDMFALQKQIPQLHVVGNVNVYKYGDGHIDTLRGCAEEGRIKAIKMYPGYQRFSPDDPAVDPIAEICARTNIPLIFHSGDCMTNYPTEVELAHPLHVDRLANRHPETRIIIAHLGFPWLMEAAMVVSKHRNVYADLSGTVVSFKQPGAKQLKERLVARYINDLKRVVDYFPILKRRLMFGTDFAGSHTTLDDVRSYLEVTRTVFFPSANDQERILVTNAREVFNLA